MTDRAVMLLALCTLMLGGAAGYVWGYWSGIGQGNRLLERFMERQKNAEYDRKRNR